MMNCSVYISVQFCIDLCCCPLCPGSHGNLIDLSTLVEIRGRDLTGPKFVRPQSLPCAIASSELYNFTMGNNSAKTKNSRYVWLFMPAHKAQDTETGGTQKSEGKTPLDRHYCWCCCRPVVASSSCSLEPAAGPDAALANPSAAPSAPGTSSANPQHCS